MSEGLEQHRDVTAFFATRRAADRAGENLRNAGFGGDRVKIEEGPRSGGSGQGFVVRVAVMGDEYERVTDILDDESTLSMDEQGADRMTDRMQDAVGGVKDAAASVRQSIGTGAEKLRQGAERLTSASPDELAAQARQAASGASTAVTDYVRANPLLSLGIAFGVGMLFGLRRR